VVLVEQLQVQVVNRCTGTILLILIATTYTATGGGWSWNNVLEQEIQEVQEVEFTSW
jgi:hypothetical protein